MAYRGRLAGMAGGVLSVLSAASLAQAPAPARPVPPPAADPVFEAAKAAFEALPEAERKGLQDALVWTGDYNSVITGTFGRRTFEGLLGYQKRTGNPSPGFPDAKVRAAILAAGEAARKAARFSVKPDAASGLVIGVPERLLPKRTAQPGGTRWQSADGRVTLDTKSSAPGETDLDALFTRATAPAADRKVTYKIKRPDFLVVTGETTTGKYYIRHAAGAEGVRGFTIAYDKALSSDVDRLVIAIANSVVPFPGADGAPAGKPGAADPASGAALKPAPLGGRAPAPAATGLIVAPGRILTSAAALEGCPAPRVGGVAASIVTRDPARNLALLETGRGPGRVAALAARTQALASGDAVVAVAAEAGGVAVAPGEAGTDGERLFAPLQPGSAGAVVLDRAGALAGLVARYPAAPRLVAGVAPPTSYPLVPGRLVAAFLAEAGITPAAGLSGATASLGAVAQTVSGAVVSLTCRP